ncbi:MAG TPA: rhodanese-like domain-containing protein, partial [Tissierellaceae bacterium]|nr:rhodanese-like domain-containing protein [Tissierellaceae bacterium]
MKNIVNGTWLKEKMVKDNLIILDIRANFDDYKSQHIKGAQHVSMKEVAASEVSEHGGRTPMPDIGRFVEDMMNLGISDDSIVLIYDNGNLDRAGRVWWLLKYIGKEDIFVLEGGIDKWIDDGGETTIEIPKANRSNKLSLNINEEIKVDMEYVR